MRSKKHVFLSLMILLTVGMGCANPRAAGGNAPANVETIVAGTLQALTPSAPTPGDAASNLLPHAMYFLNNDDAGLMQVYRLERNGSTVAKLTFEPANVDDYDISPVDGSLVYTSNNQLISARPDGSSRSILFDGGPRNEIDPFLSNVGNPVFSPNGETIAFSHKGLTFYSIPSGQFNRVLDDDIHEVPGGGFIPYVLYRPEVYTNDGSRLVLTLGHYEGASAAIYNLDSGTLTNLDSNQRSFICCGEYSLTADGTAFYSASPTFGMFPAGLWRVDLATGSVTTLLLGDWDTDPAQVADNPFLGPDGQLYFFHTSVPNSFNFGNRPPLQLVRSAVDGVTGRTVLRTENFTMMNEALWAPDASFVITAMAPIQDVYQGGAAELVYTDGGKAVIPLVPFAMQLKWGP